MGRISITVGKLIKGHIKRGRDKMSDKSRTLSLNRNQLKYIVIAAMLIDHIAWAFVPLYTPLGQIMHFFGRLTAPTMAFFVAEGYHYTRNFNKYAGRMAIFALISWLPFYFFESGRLPIAVIDGELSFSFPDQGVIYTLFLGLMAIRLWDSEKIEFPFKLIGIAFICIISVIGDWSYYAVLWCLSFHIFRDRPVIKWTAFCFIGLCFCRSIFNWNPWWGMIFQLGVLMPCPLICLFYNGKPGKKNAFNKWFFYIFYPTHMAIIGIIAKIISDAKG